MNRLPASARRSIAWLALAASAWAAAVLTTGGGAASLLGVRVVSRDSLRPAAIATALLVAGYAAFGRRFDDEFETIARGAARAAPIVAIAAAVGASAAALRWGTFAASGADAAGYVSQAALWREGRLVVRQPVVAHVRWPNADAAFAPLGYDAAPGGHAIVPAYPPGLPILIAAAQTFGGTCAASFVLPVAAGVAVWFCYLLGRRARSPATGAIAALLLASSPVFLYQALVPMSDVPAAACWTVAMCFTLARQSHDGRDLAESAAAGCGAALAIVIRPNLAPLAFVLAPFVARRADTAGRWQQRLVVFAAPVVLACVAIGFLNLYLHGSPLRSGYGDMRAAFAARNIPVNLAYWIAWLGATETPFVALAIVGVAMSLVADAGPLSPRSAAVLAASTLAVAVAYVAYTPFDEWTYLRFLLPAFPPLLVAMAAAIAWMQTRVPSAIGVTATVVLVAGVCCHGVRYAAAAGAGALGDDARRYLAVGRFIAERTPPNAVYISLQHSGSLRYYAGRPAIRFDRVGVGLDQALGDLERAGLRPYIVLEDWEETQFKQQFAGGSRIGGLAARPFARLIDYGVNVYDPQAPDNGAAPIEIPAATGRSCADR